MSWEVLDTRVLAEGWGILKSTHLSVRLADGRVSDQWRETYDPGDGAVVLPCDTERRHVLLARQFRWPAAFCDDDDPYLVEAAAGKLDGDEPADCVRSEAQEELGLNLTEPRFLFELYVSPGSITERIHYFVADYRAGDVTQRFGGLQDEGEGIEILDLPLSEALTMIADGRIRDAKTVILLQYAALHLMPEETRP